MAQIWEHQEESAKSIKLIQATKGQRFTNFIIDFFASSLIFVVFIIVVGFILEFVGIAFFEPLENINKFVDKLLGLLFRAVYYVVIEVALNGRSIGKVITGTRAVTLSGDIPDINTFVTRSFSRIVPFEPFSFLGENAGWHDRWSDTIVIDLKKSVLPEDLLIDNYQY